MQTLLAMQPDILLITCSNYIVLLDMLEFNIAIPILKIDELLFEQLSTVHSPIKLLFTNKETIEGTMARLKCCLSKPLAIEVNLIPELFDWYIAGEKHRHDQALLNYLQNINTDHYYIAVAQLSMCSSAEQFNRLSNMHILNPLSALRNYLLSL